MPTFGQGQTIVASFCGWTDCVPFGAVDMCPVPATGNATIQCLQLSTPVCTLFCDSGQTCPDGMACIGVDLSNNFSTQVCSWE